VQSSVVSAGMSLRRLVLLPVVKRVKLVLQDRRRCCYMPTECSPVYRATAIYVTLQVETFSEEQQEKVVTKGSYITALSREPTDHILCCF